MDSRSLKVKVLPSITFKLLIIVKESYQITSIIKFVTWWSILLRQCTRFYIFGYETMPRLHFGASRVKET